METGKVYFTTVYYSGYSTKHKYTHIQLYDFNDFLETCTEGIQLITGDFNIHYEDKNRPETKKFLGLVHTEAEKSSGKNQPEAEKSSGNAESAKKTKRKVSSIDILYKIMHYFTKSALFYMNYIFFQASAIVLDR